MIDDRLYCVHSGLDYPCGDPTHECVPFSHADHDKGQQEPDGDYEPTDADTWGRVDTSHVSDDPWMTDGPSEEPF